VIQRVPDANCILLELSLKNLKVFDKNLKVFNTIHYLKKAKIKTFEYIVSFLSDIRYRHFT